MVFRKPYAFFIKYFKLINFIIAFLFGLLAFNLNRIHNVLNALFLGTESNYGMLSKTYINFFLILIIVLIILLLSAVILLLRQKKKPMKDYLFAVLYIIIIIVYLVIVNNLFGTLVETVVEQTSLNAYKDVSFVIIFPIYYFIFKFILITIGFNLQKFNFQQDIIELKQEEKDNEEVELIFNKNTYKYQRKARKYLRELKYYYMENKGLINTIFIVLVGVFVILLLGKLLIKKDIYGLKKQFNAGNFTFKINEVYETQYDSNAKIIKDGYKYVIADIDIKNNGSSTNFDYNKIRLVYNDEFSYANNYFNDYFIDLGNPYNKQILNTNQPYNYIFIFEVPNTYNKNKYQIKVFDTTVYDEEDVNGVYKTVEFKVNKLSEDKLINISSLEENIKFNEKIYGNSNLTINSYSIKNSYTYDEEVCNPNCYKKTNVIKDSKANRVLLILDYKLELDKTKNISKYFVNDKDFFSKFLKVEYINNGKTKLLNNVDVLKILDGKVFASIPIDIKDAQNINAVLSFRDTQVKITLK